MLGGDCTVTVDVPPYTMLAERNTLFGFNLGVEVGQLGVIAIAWPRDGPPRVTHFQNAFETRGR